MSAEVLAEGIRVHGHKGVTYLPDLGCLPERLQSLLNPGDLVVTLGAGNVWQVGVELLRRLQGG